MIEATILIPAYNEAEVIGRTLQHLSRGLPMDRFRIVVIANACSDATASKAMSAQPRAMVVETDTPGKCIALNIGYQLAAKDKPVICLDADLDVTSESLTALIASLSEGSSHAACGQMDVRANEATSLVRAYYKGWRTNPYFDKGKFGGLFALSAQAAARLFPLPYLTADDEYIRRSLHRDEIAFVSNCRFTARAPKTLSSLVAVRRRSLRGARTITSMGLPSPETGSLGTVLKRAVHTPSIAFPILVYACVNAWSRLSLFSNAMASENSGIWERDLTTRSAG
ncbi:glycosyltransferase family 2 protein [Shimia abyssi]|uniref:Glycosyltransferase involved in cell wall biosynthesis n=1 Tax=Shimia abyssi TaxID=1662395 RepID=A0A2P8FJS4_9RHOB|nr:glycosyltransferase [Shimia abyssi]PSL21976.1 glycosyltransferase involved in cell wall biosynthesis [Shimia abyssi]